MSVDPFTRASPTYQAATRHPHKTGAAYEGYSPRGESARTVLLLVVGIAIVAIGLALCG